MQEQRHVIRVYPFSYNKIIGGERKIDIRPYTKGLQELRVGDLIEYMNIETKTSTIREIKGIALFPDFNTLIRMLPPQPIGYDNREEIRIRVERMYTPEEEAEYGVCALFIEEPSVKQMMKLSRLDRSA